MAKILIAEDELDIRELVAFTLKYAGLEVLTVKDGQEALDAAHEAMPDLIILDVRMPHLTGYEVCKVLRADPAYNQVPIVFLSAKGQEAEIKAGLDAGANAYLLKPFSPADLTEQIKSILASFGK